MRRHKLSPSGLVLVVALVLNLAGCAPTSQNNESTKNDSHGGDPFGGSSFACYPGLQAQVCFSTVLRSSLSEQTALYQYPDPMTDKSFPKSFNKLNYIPPDRLIDLRQVPWKQPLTLHFERFEVMPDNPTRGSFGLFSLGALYKIEQLRDSVNRPLFISSGYRSPGHNSQLEGAAKWSRHTYGDAIDFSVSGVDYKTLAQHCLRNGASFYQLYSDHIHCDWRNLSQDPAFFPVGMTLKSQERQDGLSYEGRLHIRVEEQKSMEPTLVLTAEVLQEDEGELTHEWRVTDPSGRLWIGVDRVARFPKMSGQYKVEVLVGGSALIQDELTVP